MYKTYLWDVEYIHHYFTLFGSGYVIYSIVPYMTHLPEPIDIVLAIPGQWPDFDTLQVALAEAKNDFILTDAEMLHMVNDQAYAISWETHEPALAATFETTGKGLIRPDIMARIEAHTFTLYLARACDDAEELQQMMEAAAAILEQGGLAVKLETAGLAHPPATWFKLTRRKGTDKLVEAFVQLVRASQPNTFYSCGMHQLSLPDLCVEAPLEAEQAVMVMQRVLIAVQEQSPQKLQLNFDIPCPSGQKWAATLAKDAFFEADDLFHNPWGRYLLQTVAK
jgi:hypothetical protein